MSNRENMAVEVTAECVPNIGIRGRRRRTVIGVAWLAVTVLVFAELAWRHAGAGAALLVAPFAAIAGLYFFQAKEKT